MNHASAAMEARDPDNQRTDRTASNSMMTDPSVGMATSPPPVSPANVAMLEAGTEVEIDGLIARPDFNGLSGVVQAWDPMLRRYEVLLDVIPVGHASRLVKTKRENLRLRPPPPPTSAAALLATTLDLCRCLPSASESSSAVVIDPSPQAQDSPGWAHWQFCDANLSPSADASICSFGTSEAVWDYNMALSSYDLADHNPAWLQSPM